jgi:metal-responsive CopG/Arc/MetJ family transcriptional regulator
MEEAISIPTDLIAEVDKLMGGKGFWPSMSAFMREAAMEKVKRKRGK